MKRRFVPFVAAAFLCFGSLCQATTDNAAGAAPQNTAVANGQCALSGNPTAVRSLEESGSAGDMFAAQDRALLSKLFGSPAAAYQCPNGNPKCGQACCSSDEQCCLNRSNSTWYCSKKCD